MIATTSDVTFMLLVTILPAAFLILILLIIFCRPIQKFAMKRLIERSFLIAFEKVELINNQIWVWPELLKGVEMDQLGSTVVGPRLIFSSASYAKILEPQPKSVIVMKYTLKPLKLVLCAVNKKRVKSDQIVDESATLTFKLQKRRDIRHYTSLISISHAAIAELLHISIDDHNTLFVFYADMSKGNLEDVLISRRFGLNMFIKHGMYFDLISGLRYIHQSTSFKFHGSLCPKKCLINETWGLKIAGFGHSAYIEDNMEYIVGSAYHSAFFRAPELLLDKDVYDNSIYVLQMADIYSLGMLFCSIFTEKLPFEGQTEHDCLAILERIPSDFESFSRPRIDSFIRYEINNTIKQSWQHDPSIRPYINELYTDIFKMSPFLSTRTAFNRNDFASLCTALYATDLEEFIKKIESAYTNKTIQNISSTLTKAEKEHRLFNQTEVLSTKVKELESNRENERIIQTQEIVQLKTSTKDEVLRLEKQMIDLKYSLLPLPFMQSMTDTSSKRLIMDKLMIQSGANIVDLERNIRTYSQVTIMVVSIAGFGEFVHRLSSTPHLVLELMNRFYAVVDTITSANDGVYCVDKVCEQVVFVCGAPVSRKNHCELSLRVALQLKDWCNDWDASWILGGQDEKLELRFGIHSGPILGGIIGKLPKFILIGGMNYYGTIIVATFDIAVAIHGTSTGNQIKMSSVSQSLISGNRAFLFENMGQVDLGDKCGKVWTFLAEAS